MSQLVHATRVRSTLRAKSLNSNFNGGAEHVERFDVMPEIYVWRDQAYENVLCIIGFMGVWHMLNFDPMFGQWQRPHGHLYPPRPNTCIVVTTQPEEPRFSEHMHDTRQLRVAGRQIDPTHFKGVFAADRVPWTKMSTCSEWSVILNTDPGALLGEHWVAGWRWRWCWFLDSYGLKPTHYRPLP